LVASPPELPEPVGLRIFPDPAPGPALNLGIELPLSGQGQLEIFDMLGRSQGKVDLGLLSAGEQTLRHELQALSPGVYVLRPNAGRWSAVETLILH
jgi:hypothetical protein